MVECCSYFITGKSLSGTGPATHDQPSADKRQTEAPPTSTLTESVQFGTDAAGRQIETIELQKGDSRSLGFSVVGLRSEHRGELGIFVQEVQEGGIAHQ